MTDRPYAFDWVAIPKDLGIDHHSRCKCPICLEWKVSYEPLARHTR